MSFITQKEVTVNMTALIASYAVVDKEDKYRWTTCDSEVLGTFSKLTLV